MAGGQVVGDNLSTDGHWDSGAKATANDLLAVPASNTNNITDSASAMAGIDLDLLKLAAGRTGKFGSSGTPIDVVADEMDLAGGGGVYINCGTGALVTDKVKVRMDNVGIEVILGSSGTSTWRDMDFDRGGIQLAGSILFHASAAVRIGQVSSLNDVLLTIAAAAATLPRLDQFSGLSRINNTLTLLNMSGGTCVKDEAPVTQAFVGPGCTLTYNHKVLTGETTKIVVAPGGFLDLLGNTEPKVLDDVHIKKGGKIRWLENSKMHTITVFRDDNQQ